MDPAIDFTKCPFVYWSNVVKFSYLQRRIIVYSIMYYECDESCVSDNYYDRMSQQLVGLINNAHNLNWKHPRITMECTTLMVQLDLMCQDV